MPEQVENFITVEQYLSLERKAEEKSEYYNGEMFAMAGASRAHNLINGNIFAALHSQLSSRDCEIYHTDMRLKVTKTGLYTYPDIVVSCERPRFDDDHSDILLNPTLIIEVLSKSTESYDRGKKFEHYRQLASLQEYILISQDRKRVEQYIKQNDRNWLFSEQFEATAKIELPSIDCQLLIEDIYQKVDLSTLQ